MSSEGQLVWDLVKTRHGKKHFVKAVKVAKDYSWRTSLASLTVKVAGYSFLTSTFTRLNSGYVSAKLINILKAAKSALYISSLGGPVKGRTLNL